MARRFRKTPSIRRRVAQKEAELRIIIICEGKNTEPEYIKNFARDKKHPLIEFVTIDGVGVPKTIVNKAIEEKGNLQKKARKSGNSFDKMFEIWCVSDKDEHPRINEEMQRAKDNGIKYALSNPCIELWGYLHYAQNDAPTHRHDMQKMLASIMSGYDHKHSARFNYDHMKDGYNDAVARAMELKMRRENEDDVNGNTSTNIYELMETICKAK